MCFNYLDFGQEVPALNLPALKHRGAPITLHYTLHYTKWIVQCSTAVYPALLPSLPPIGIRR